MTTAIKIKTATAAQQRTFGLVKPTVTVRVTKQKLQGGGLVHLKEYQDDLDRYEADFMMVDNVPVVLQRYVSNAKNQYTVLVDSQKAVEQGKDPWAVSDSFLSALEVSKDRVVWENTELRSLLQKSARKTSVATKSVRLTGPEGTKAKKSAVEVIKSAISKKAVGTSDRSPGAVTVAKVNAAQKKLAAKETVTARPVRKSDKQVVVSKVARRP